MTMTPEEWQRIRPILESALELEPAKRPGFLDGACQDAALRHEVESLIASSDEGGASLLETPPVPNPALEQELQLRLRAGTRVGAYQIVKEIAQGGMGAVYQAVRADGQYKQRVALKIVRSEFGGEFTAARFRNERQILASLDHPNIAKILDGGTTAEGVPFFVMEFIDGKPITEYCDQQKLTVDARLKLFRAVCSAVHYAHQHLVVHRDIKPSNILVTAEGAPKLLDFGIAKLLNPNLLPEHLTFTAGGFAVMTPEYASPEQLSGAPLTTATDVYSLGLVLYELLAGRRAFRFSSPMPHEVAKVVLESDPEKPSAATAREEQEEETIIEGPRNAVPITPQQISSLRSELPDKLRRRLSGDLDNIVLKALRKEVAERYSSADQLSDDIRRHLEGLPVLARKSSVAYRCRKYVQRHKVVVASAAIVFLSLVTGLLLTLREARIARANQLRAEKRFNDVRMLAGSLIFEVHDSIRGLPGATAARKLIVQRAQEYLDRLAAESSNDPALLRELAAAYGRLGSVLGNGRDANLGDSEQSHRDYLRAIQLREEASAAVPTDLVLRREMAEGYLFLPHEADFLQKAFSILEPMAAANPSDPKIRYDLAKAHEWSGFKAGSQAKWEEAKGEHAKSLEIYQRLADEYPKNEDYLNEVAFAHKHLGGVLTMQQKWQPALAEYLQALPMDEAQIRANPQDTNARYAITFTYADVGQIYRSLGDLGRALSYYQKCFEIRKALADADPQDTRAHAGLANVYGYLGYALMEKGNFKESLKDHREALALRQALSDGDPKDASKRLQVAYSQGSIAQTLAKMAVQETQTSDRRKSLCREAAPLVETSLAELERDHNSDEEFKSAVRQAGESCKTALSRVGSRGKGAVPPNNP